MLHYPQNFIQLFSKIKHGENYSRKNKILLSLFKSGPWIFKTDLCKITDMAQLENSILDLIQQSGCDDENLCYRVELNGYTFYSSQYSTDIFKGVCEDGSIEFVRYTNVNLAKVFKMKAGKMLRALILETGIGRKLPETVIIYLCEQFTNKWKAYTSSLSNTKRLHVDHNFKAIYSSKSLKGDFGSCMVEKNHYHFYESAVDASAAYLTEDRTGLIIARAIVFSAYDEDGNKWRLCERQYSSESSEVYKQMLVDALYEGGYIDGHKTVGASCHDARLFVDKNGNSLANKKFYIDCDLDTDQIVSYMDSFKYYNINEGKAYNFETANYTYTLDITEATIDDYVNGDDDDDDQYYDEYHDRDCSDITYVHYHGREISCDSNDLNDFTWIDRHNAYYHDDDIVFAVDTQKYELKEDCFYSQLIDDYFYNEEKFKEAEKAFVEKNWFYSDIDDDYFESTLEITVINIWNNKEKKYEEKTISCSTLDDGIDSGKYFEFDRCYFDVIDPSTNLPFGYKLVKCETLNTTANEAA